ncbi:MAG TPA: Ppx/GppA family phosphatase, partial [Bacteroidota bacterium]|nr:Ppx/GppA family phosphatase [Bacteroidota bacterium]
VPRLGRGVDSRGMLERGAMDRVIGVLNEYRGLMAPYAPEATAVCGTSAVRDAANREEFADRVRRETSFELEILSGDEEALLTYRGGVSGAPAAARYTVVDIGGGSTEIITGGARSIDARISLDIGSVRLTERFLRHDPPLPAELEKAIDLTEQEIERAALFPFEGSTLVGVAGTATSLAVLAQDLKEFDINAVTNYALGRDRVESLFRSLCVMPSSAIRGLSRVMEGRSDVIVAGTLIAREIMAHYGFASMIVSERGVRYGIALREAERLAGTQGS